MTERITWAFAFLCHKAVIWLPLPKALQTALLPYAGIYGYSTSFGDYVRRNQL